MGEVILERTELIRRLASHRERGDRLILTNGAFDLLHVGHLRSLLHARQLGDVLIVGVNSDASVAASKGPDRPIVPAEERAEMLAALEPVSYVTVFPEATADALLEDLRPHVHAKGHEYTADDKPGEPISGRPGAPGAQPMPERDTASRLGIEVAIVGDPKDHSTSWMLERIARLHRGERT